jgi:hypothetical protein
MGAVFFGYGHACITTFSVLTLPYPASSYIYRLGEWTSRVGYHLPEAKSSFTLLTAMVQHHCCSFHLLY